MARRVLVTGARDWQDKEVIADAMLEARDRVDLSGSGLVVLVHGACPTGADAIADEWAGKWGWEVERHAADWGLHGKAGGPIRNQRMVELGADVCLAFIGKKSRGTVHCANAAEAAGIPVWRFYEEN